MNVLPLEKQVRVIAALVEGVSIRATCRLVDADKGTVISLGVRVGEACARLHSNLFRDLNVSLIQLDEIWSFIGAKQGHRQPHHADNVGDCYTWIALDATNKAILSYRVGKRSWEDCRQFIWDLRQRVVSRPQITSDGYAPYAPTIKAAFGRNVDYGQLQKIYEEPEREPEASRRYSPSRVVRVDREAVYGSPEEAQISTSFVERQNLTLRMQMRRFTRLTNAFSRRPRNHAAAVALHVAHYNLCRWHETIRCTPAMALGVTDHVWTIEELIEAAMSAPEPKPGPKAPRTSDRTGGYGFNRNEGLPEGRKPVQLRVIPGGRMTKPKR
jgi:IS1 family transposase